MMTNLNRARDERSEREKKEAVELCGKNRGPHDYIPIEWRITDSSHRVTKLLCRICFCHISVQNLIENCAEVSY